MNTFSNGNAIFFLVHSKFLGPFAVKVLTPDLPYLRDAANYGPIIRGLLSLLRDCVCTALGRNHQGHDQGCPRYKTGKKIFRLFCEFWEKAKIRYPFFGVATEMTLTHLHIPCTRVEVNVRGQPSPYAHVYCSLNGYSFQHCVKQNLLNPIPGPIELGDPLVLSPKAGNHLTVYFDFESIKRAGQDICQDITYQKLTYKEYRSIT